MMNIKITIKQAIYLVIILIVSCKNTAQKQGIQFSEGNWTAIQKKAKEKDQLIFIDFYTTWCGPCKVMDKNVFSNRDIGGYFNKNFVAYKVDAEKGEGISLNKQYGISSYPSLLFVNHSGKVVMKKSGAMDVDAFLKYGKEVSHAEQELANMNMAYTNGQRDAAFISNYLSSLKARGLPTEKVMMDYLSTIAQTMWLAEDNFNLISDYIETPYNKVFEYLARQRKVSGRNNYKARSASSDIVYRYLNTLVTQRKDLEEIDRLISHLTNLGYKAKVIAYYKFKSHMLSAKRDKDWEEYTQVIITYVNTYALDQPISLNNYAYAFYKNPAITGPKALNEALGWVNKALEKHSANHLYLDTKAAVLYKLGRKEEALIEANKAVKIAEQLGTKASETLELIEKIKAD